MFAVSIRPSPLA